MIVVLLVCLLVGFLVGLAGVGGILVPPVLILMSGLEPHTAMGTALASFIGTGFVGTWLYHKNGHYRFIEAVPFALGSFVCAAPGALVNARIDAGPLVMILAVIIVFAGACTLRPPKPGRKGSPFWLGWKGRAVIGGATGFMAGLTGAGGPVASIPWMVLVGYSPIHAVALSMPYQIATSFSGSVGNMMGGHVDWMLLPALCAVQVVGLLGGIAMAQRAGVRLDNLEYVQFHPTALYTRQSHSFLITEAMRGEGARLTNAKGEFFMKRYDERADLAPRDIVARAIMDEMLHSGEPCMYLDVSGVKHDIPTRFPTIYQHCMELGIDINKKPIPVVPVAHFFCGGILVDASARTTLTRLYSVGECSCTGLHGANRLASTSLLEALLWGYSAGQDIAQRITKRGYISKRLADAIPDWESTGDERNDDPALIAQDWATIRNTMWNYVGISRSKARLRRAFEDMRDLVRHIHDFYKGTRISKPLVDLFHGSQTAYVITQAAMRNKNSIGCHHRVD